MFLGAQFDSICWISTWKDSAWAALRQGHLASAEWRRKALSAAAWSTWDWRSSRIQQTARQCVMQTFCCTTFWLALHFEVYCVCSTGTCSNSQGRKWHAYRSSSRSCDNGFQLATFAIPTAFAVHVDDQAVGFRSQGSMISSAACSCAGLRWQGSFTTPIPSWQPRLPPLLPSHLGVFRRGAHFMHMRHFPLKFVRETLQKMCATGAAFPEAPTLLDPQEAMKTNEAMEEHIWHIWHICRLENFVNLWWFFV